MFHVMNARSCQSYDLEHLELGQNISPETPPLMLLHDQFLCITYSYL